MNIKQTTFVVSAISAIALMTGIANSQKVGETDNGLSVCEEKYLVAYNEVTDTLGQRAPGRNFVSDGIIKANGEAGPINNERACNEVDDLNALIAQPEPVVTSSTTTETSTSVTTESTVPTEEPVATETSSGTASAIPSYITECESGGDYGAVNPSSGAYGAYQIIPSTSQAYGCDLSTPAGQDACAAEIYADVGTSAWDCG